MNKIFNLDRTYSYAAELKYVLLYCIILHSVFETPLHLFAQNVSISLVLFTSFEDIQYYIVYEEQLCIISHKKHGITIPYPINFTSVYKVDREVEITGF